MTAPRSGRILSVALAASLLALAPMAAEEVEAPRPPEIAIASVAVEPGRPAADTLCRLRVQLENSSDSVISQLGFTVRINDRELPVYRNQLFMFPLQPGATSELALFNFWSTETGRPMPADGKLRVEVELREAQTMRIETIDGVETWTPLGAVAGLPVTSGLELAMTR